MTFTDQGTRVPAEWCPLAMANGMEWAAQGRRFESLYRWWWSPHAAICAALYLAGFVLGKLYHPAWASKRRMAKAAMLAILMSAALPLWAASAPLRIDLAGVGATDGPSPGLAIGADIPLDSEWAWTLRASRLDEDEATAHTFLAGLEYGFPSETGAFIPYLGYRVGGRWSSEEAAACSGGGGAVAFAANSDGPGPEPGPGSPEAFGVDGGWCDGGELSTSAFVYQVAVGMDWQAAKSIWGATVEAAWSDTTDSDGGVEFLVGVSIRP